MIVGQLMKPLMIVPLCGVGAGDGVQGRRPHRPRPAQRILALLLAALSAVVGMMSSPAHAVVGGHDTAPGAFPYMVSVRWSSSHRCGGVIISDQWVLTIAQCVEGKSPSDLVVRAGTDRHATPGVDFKVAEVITHPDYDNWTNDYDIAAIKIDGQFSLGTGGIDKVALPTSDADPAPGTAAEVAGWGAVTAREGAALSETLQVALVPLIARDVCQQKHNGFNAITDRMLCAGWDEGGVDACTGDEGGPLVQNGVLIGLVSWGYGCARPNRPGVYTKVGALTGWITELTEVAPEVTTTP
ncbi:serine protease [Kitasatospora sp. NPDC048194]|uniref:serine protease n=1 Tax=Kitasatospora sp. NPDC048194 TaxID=3364045 RepID=UPI0037176A15